MECVICKNGTTIKGFATITLERNGSVIVFKNVAADVCDNCGEYYLDEATSKQVLKQANQSIENGAEFEVCKLKVA
jgi:YgiT-type zinc finger domain-containing protein